MLMVVGTGNACVDTHYRSNDGAQHHQEELDHLSSTLPTFSPIVGFREDCRQNRATCESHRPRRKKPWFHSH